MPGKTGAGSGAKTAVEFDEKKVDAIFAELDQRQLPGAAVGMAIGGRPVYRKGFGLANMELPVALSPAIRMRIGSTTKHFTSLAYMLLCEEGKAGLDDPVGQHLPELHPVTHKVTARQLMGHLGGLRDVYDISFYFNGMGRPVSSADLLSMYRDIDDVNAAPGIVWDYNNGGYLMLSAAIERIAGQPLEEVLRERILEPLGMRDTLLRRLETDFVPNSASPHMTKLADFVSNSARPHLTNLVSEFEKSYFGTDFTGAGALMSTIDDMLRWLAHMDAPVVGTAATWNIMKAPQVLANGTSTGYGLGLMTGHYRGVETLFHAGGWLGGNAQMLKIPQAGLDIMVIVNRHDVSAGQLVNKMLDACLPGLNFAREVSKVPIATGTFRSPTTGRVIQLYGRDGQQVASIDGFDWPFVRDSEGVLRHAPVWSYIKQAVTLAGDLEKPDSIRLDDFGNLDQLVREPPPSEYDVAAIIGRYRSNTTHTEATISNVDDELRLATAGRFGSAQYRLQCIARGIWRVNDMNGVWGAMLSFDDDCQAFRFNSYHTWVLHFRRSARADG